MTTPSIALPSGSSNGLPIALGTSSTTLHTTPNTPGMISEVFLWVSSIDSANNTTVTVSVGGINWSILTVAALAGPYAVLPGLRVGPNVTISATAAVANRAVAVLNINAITP